MQNETWIGILSTLIWSDWVLLVHTANNSSWAIQSWSESGIYQSGYNTVHIGVKSHSSTQCYHYWKLSCASLFWICKISLVLNTSKLLTISKGWMWHLLSQRQWVQCLALRLHVSKRIFVCLTWKKSDPYLLEKEQSSSIHSKEPALTALSYSAEQSHRQPFNIARDSPRSWEETRTGTGTHPSPSFHHFDCQEKNFVIMWMLFRHISTITF